MSNTVPTFAKQDGMKFFRTLNSKVNNYFKENNIDASLFKSNDFILFEYTIENWRNTLDILDENEIEYSIHTDKEDLDYIVV